MKKFLSFAFSAAAMSIFCSGTHCYAQSFEIEQIKGNPFRDVSFVDGVNPRGNALHIEGDRLFYGGGDTFYVFDITKPGYPKQLGNIRLAGLCRQIAVKGDVAYVASRETGVWVLDIKDPKNIKLLTRYDAAELATGLDIAGDVLFISLRINGVEFVDISDPANPQHIYLQKTSESQSCWYQDGILYSGDWGKREITAISAADMSDIEVLYKQPLNGNGDGVIVQGKYLYAATGHHSNFKELSKDENFGNGHALEIFDISNPMAPERLSRTQFEKLYYRGNDYWSVRPSGDAKTAFVSDTFNGIYSVDISNPEKARINGRIIFKTSGDKNTPVSAVELGNGFLYAAVYQGGLAVVECPKSNPVKVDKGNLPKNVSFRDPYETANDSRFINWKPRQRAQVRSAAASGDIIYAACSSAGLAILRLTGEGKVEEISYGPQKFAGDLKVRDGKLYVAEGADGLGIYDITDPANPREITHFTNLGKLVNLCLWVTVPNERYIAVSQRLSGYTFLDVKDFPKYRVAFHFGGCPGWDRYIANEASKDDKCLYGVAHKGAVWVDLSGDKPSVSPKDNDLQVRQTSGVTHYKNGTALAVDKGQLVILESGGKRKDARVAGSNLEGAPTWDGGNLLALNQRVGKSISLVDVSDDSDPKVLWTEKTAGMPEMPVFHQGKLIVPCGYQGLLIQK